MQTCKGGACGKKCDYPCVLNNLIKFDDLSWKFYYPFFANNYILAHHLGKAVKNWCSYNNKEKLPSEINKRIIRHSSWPDLPSFRCDNDLDIFVGTELTERRLKKEGHSFSRLNFTGYHVRKFFINKQRFSKNHKDKLDSIDNLTDLAQFIIDEIDIREANDDTKKEYYRIYFITDARPSAVEIKSQLENKVKTISEDAFKKINFRVRFFTSRDEGDLYDENTIKIYVFGAPRAAFYAKNIQNSNPAYTKYCQLVLSGNDYLHPIDTFLYIRRNREISETNVKQIISSLSEYFNLVLDEKNYGSNKNWYKDLVPSYNRIAHSAKDIPLLSENPKSEEAVEDFLKMLSDHHVSPTGEQIDLGSGFVDLPSYESVSVRSTNIRLNRNLEDKLKLLKVRCEQIENFHLMSNLDANDGQQKNSVWHFAPQSTLTAILEQTKLTPQEGSPIRAHDVETMNDPLEGSALIHCLEDLKENNNYLIHNLSKEYAKYIGKKYFENVFYSWQSIFNAAENIETNVGTPVAISRIFTTSFCIDGDRLDLWRGYGKDATGVALVTPHSEIINRDELSGNFYKVFYGFEQKLRAINLLAEPINEIYKLLEGIKKSDIPLFQTTCSQVKQLTRKVMHLYKHDQYKNENEARLLFECDLGNENIMIQPTDDVDKLYIEYKGFLKSKESAIFLGSKYPERESFSRVLQHQFSQWHADKAPKVYLSKLPYK